VVINSSLTRSQATANRLCVSIHVSKKSGSGHGVSSTL